MENALTVLMQVVIMLILAGIGVIMFRAKKISLEGSKTLGNILIYLSLPAVIINGFLVERTAERLTGLALSALLAAATLFIAIVISRLCFKNDAVAQFAAAFSNPGFFGVPIIVSCLGSGAVFYIAAYVAFLNLLQWTYGVSLLKGERERFTIKKLLVAPFFIAIVIGLILFLTGVKLPELVTKTLGFVSGLNTPLAMFTVGVYMAQINVKDTVKKLQLYKVSLIKLAAIPAAAILILLAVPEKYFSMKLALLIAVACPTGSNIAVYAQLHNRDYAYAVETVIVSTVFSIVTLPLAVRIAELVW